MKTTPGTANKGAMNQPEGTVYMRGVQRALDIAGSNQRLADVLGVSTMDVLKWRVGEADPPPALFSIIVDIIAAGTLSPAVHPKRNNP